jgi:LEA14-like dessication related protein
MENPSGFRGATMRLVCRRAVWILLLAACTVSPVTVALAVENRNDYPLSTERVELSLRMDGVPIGHLAHNRRVPVATDTISTVAMPLALEKQATSDQLQSLGSGAHLFAVRGKATFRTPIGRREVRFAQQGSMVFGRRSTLSP